MRKKNGLKKSRSMRDGDDEIDELRVENGQAGEPFLRKKSSSAAALPVVHDLDGRGRTKRKGGFPSITRSLMRSFSSKQANLDDGNRLKSSRDSKSAVSSRHAEEDDLSDFDDTGIDYTSFTELLMKPDHSVAFALCTSLLNSDEAATVSPQLIQLIDANRQSIPIFKKVIQHEIEKTKDEGTLLRNTCVATLLMSAYGRLVGELYLSQLLKPLVFEFPKSQSFEIDPNRITKGSVEENMNNLIKLTKKFIDQIVNSLELCPKSLRVLCSLLQKEVSKKFPQSRLSSVGGFFFLRFICPAIVTPETFGIVTVEGIDSAARRALVLVSKILQSLTNGVPFGEKEAYMVPLNSFIEQHIARIQEFFDKLTTLEDHEVTPRESIEVIDRRSMRIIFQYVRANLRRLHDELSGSSLVQTLDYDPYRELAKIVSSLKKSSRNTIEVQGPTKGVQIGLSPRGSASGPMTLSTGDRRSFYV